MKRTSLLFFLLLTVFVGGCFYEAPVSLTPSQEIDRSLLGAWENADDHKTELQITEADRRHYTISLRPSKGGFIDLGPMDFRGYHVKVAGIDIVNLQLTDPKTKKPGPWVLLNYTHLDADTMVVRLINQQSVPLPPNPQQGNPSSYHLTTPDAMQKHIESIAPRPDLFSGGEMMFQRTKK